ncbi:MAG TPA: hypothetical protein EYP04_09355 [Anaerolineae bacterium]|nr:hypothetical protein [Anaerolineae bacterium]HIQ06499.1 hypothetical protein [Anaerolineae bacterium]
MKQELNPCGHWKLRHFEPGCGEEQRAFSSHFCDTGWLVATVPGDVHLDLERAGMIPDPFYAANAEECRWIEKQEWWYKRQFTVPSELIRQPAKLVFEGLDCFAIIWLNDERLGEHQDMFVSCEFDASGRLREMNTLAARLDSPRRAVADKDVTELTASHKERIYARNCQMGYGWDFAPRLVTVGIWRPVRLLFLDRVAIEDVFVQTEMEDAGAAQVQAEITLSAYLEKPATISLELDLSPANFSGQGLSAAAWQLTLSQGRRKWCGRPYTWRKRGSGILTPWGIPTSTGCGSGRWQGTSIG